MRILIVDDENTKVVEICGVLRDAQITEESITVATTAASALKELKESYFDLLIIDMYLPNRIGEAPSLSGGVDLLKRINRGNDVQLPEHILGLTSNLEALAASEEDFSARSWFVEEVGPSKTTWKLRLMEKLQYLKAREEYQGNQSKSEIISTRPECEVLFVCALLDPELTALHAVSGCDWEVVTFPGDPGIYWSASLKFGANTVSAICVCLPQMGLVAAGVTAAKAITLFKPKLVVMTGICAGRKGDCDLGDIIGANLTWDYGSGKFTEVAGAVVFEPAPFQAAATARVGGVLAELSNDNELLQKLYKESPGYRPAKVPKFHVAPLASGAAVQNHKEFFSGVVTQQRKMLGVDMEAFAIAWACHEALEPQPSWLVIKSVVDFADGTKDSQIQSFGSYISASLAIYAVDRLINR
ncbi:conserved response regulator receiver protein of 44.8 kDa (plasmid) [Sinorhizobium fredii NGR234]|uniref:Uncharacterized protein y4jS n=1 Tax=Sinorhizobium fredii (strain NBRC 101917 / NGR234) TaxID=394 RepID=Y4JS_SINFN|nr:response regulator [Sinorhizobium fredii]P55519.1 RecName: Full=Uncharacterized protein y4jS [Sinorhizobium fredii NGR234]AAB91731.1 conserved response regulator receiver protein of 44.8 kDa [Sinorhizobium fredii NGR234]